MLSVSVTVLNNGDADPTDTIEVPHPGLLECVCLLIYFICLFFNVLNELISR